MKIRALPDGSLEIRESFNFLRIASVVCACLAVSVFLFKLGSGSGETGKVGWAALGVGVLCLAGAVVDNRYFLFDTNRKVLAWKRSNLFRSVSGQLPFSDIKDIVVVRKTGRDDDHTVGGYNVTYSAVLVTAAGTMPLSGYHSRNEREYRELVDTLLEVLAAPEKTPAKGDEVERLIAAGYMIDAVSLIRARDGLDLTAARALAHKIQQSRDRS